MVYCVEEWVAFVRDLLVRDCDSGCVLDYLEDRLLED